MFGRRRLSLMHLRRMGLLSVRLLHPRTIERMELPLMLSFEVFLFRHVLALKRLLLLHMLAGAGLLLLHVAALKVL